MRVDFNEVIREHGVDCVFQSWGSNKFVEWKFGSEASNWARQGRVSLIEHVDRFQPTVADGDSGAPLLCSLANQDAPHEGVV